MSQLLITFGPDRHQRQCNHLQKDKLLPRTELISSLVYKVIIVDQLLIQSKQEASTLAIGLLNNKSNDHLSRLFKGGLHKTDTPQIDYAR